MSESLGPQGLRQPSPNQEQQPVPVSNIHPRAFQRRPPTAPPHAHSQQQPQQLFPGIPPNAFPPHIPTGDPQQPPAPPGHHGLPGAAPQHPAPHAVRKGPHAQSSITKFMSTGPCVQQLVTFSNKQGQGLMKKSCLERYWKPLVDEFFAPNATIMLDFELKNVRKDSIELPIEAMPRMLQSKYDVGIVDERMFMECPNEFELENGMVVVDCPKTTVITSFQHCKVCNGGHLRVSFAADRKITFWEFTTTSHEELFLRDTIERNPTLPDPECTPFGIPKASLMLYTIAQTVNDMRNHVMSRILGYANAMNGGTQQPPPPPPQPSVMPNGVVGAKRQSEAPKDGGIIAQLKDQMGASRLTNMGPAPPDYAAMGALHGSAHFDLDQPGALDGSQNAAALHLYQSQQQQQLQSLNMAHNLRAMQAPPPPTHNDPMLLDNPFRAVAPPVQPPSRQPSQPDAIWPGGPPFATDLAAKPPSASAPAGLEHFTPSPMTSGAPPAHRAPGDAPGQRTAIMGEVLTDALSSMDPKNSMFDMFPLANGGGEPRMHPPPTGNGAPKTKRRRSANQSTASLL